MPPIIKTNSMRQVRDYLKENINNSTWQTGENIPSEKELTQTLQVSRLSIRMAIQQLVGIGLLESVHGKGTFVVNNDIFSLTERMSRIGEEGCREIIEPVACYYAAMNAAKENLAALGRFLDIMDSNAGNLGKFVRSDMGFHDGPVLPSFDTGDDEPSQCCESQGFYGRTSAKGFSNMSLPEQVGINTDKETIL